jgi:HAMP domain-containing protein
MPVIGDTIAETIRLMNRGRGRVVFWRSACGSRLAAVLPRVPYDSRHRTFSACASAKTGIFRRVTFLKNLRLNCLLVPAVLAVAAMLAWSWAWWRAGQQGIELRREALAASLGAFAALGGEAAPSLDAWLAADRRWTGLAVVRLDGERLAVIAAAGNKPALDAANPSPVLIDAVGGPHAWPLADGRWAAAAPIRGGSGVTNALLYGETRPFPARDLNEWIYGLLAIAVLGAGLGWYLARRVYAPVEYLSRQAEAALAGQPPVAGNVDSDETGALRSSVNQLVERVRSSAAPPPPEG